MIKKVKIQNYYLWRHMKISSKAFKTFRKQRWKNKMAWIEKMGQNLLLNTCLKKGLIGWNRQKIQAFKEILDAVWDNQWY